LLWNDVGDQFVLVTDSLYRCRRVEEVVVLLQNAFYFL
jgi:hypothetical protein